MHDRDDGALTEQQEDEILAEMAAERLCETKDAIPIEDLAEFNK